MSELSNKEKGLASAYNMYLSDFLSADPENTAKLSGCVYEHENSRIMLKYINENYFINTKTGDISCENKNSIKSTIKTLLLGYLVTAKGQKETGEYIKFRDIHGAAQYEEPFNSRTINPMVKSFSKRPDDFMKIGKMLGGIEKEIADIAIEIQILPLLKVTYGLYFEDEEFPAEGVILFDLSAKRLCTVEIIVVAASDPIYEMLGILYK